MGFLRSYSHLPLLWNGNNDNFILLLFQDSLNLFFLLILFA